MTVWDSLAFTTSFQSDPVFYENFNQSYGYAMYSFGIWSAETPVLSNLRSCLSPNMTRANFYFNQGLFGSIDLQSG